VHVHLDGKAPGVFRVHGTPSIGGVPKSTALRCIKDDIGVQHVDMKQWVLTRLHDEMMRCVEGLENLKATYNDDVMVAANVEVLIDRINAQCRTIATRKPDRDAPKHITPDGKLVSK
jgi:hypothetical protein